MFNKHTVDHESTKRKVGEEMELDTTIIHGNRKVNHDQTMTALFAAGYNAYQVYKIMKNNNISLSRGTVYNRWKEWIKEKAATTNEQL